MKGIVALTSVAYMSLEAAAIHWISVVPPADGSSAAAAPD